MEEEEKEGQNQAEMEDDDDEEAQRQAQLAEQYRRMLLELESDEEAMNEGEEGAKPLEEDVEKKPPKDGGAMGDKRPLLSESLNSSLGVIPDRKQSPPPIRVENFDKTEVKITVESSLPADSAPKVDRQTTPPGGRTSPTGRSSPFRNNRVEPMVVVEEPEKQAFTKDSEVSKNNNSQGVMLKDVMQAFKARDGANHGKVSTPDSGVDSLGSEKRPSVKTLNDVEKVGPREDSETKMRNNKVFMRTFKQRSSQENFALYGLLTPALCLVPRVDGTDALTQTFTELKGEDRELKLAAAHIDDAISGRGKYGKARAFFKPKFGRWCFKMINNKYFKGLVLLMATLHLVLTFFEPPSKQLEQQASPTIYIVLALTPLCLIVYAIDVGVHMGFLSWRVFWSLDENRWLRSEFVFTCMYCVDYFMLVLEVIIGKRLAQPFRCLRAFIILCKLNNVQHIWDVVMSSVVKFVEVFVGIVFFIIVFSAVGVHLYDNTYHNITSSDDSSGCDANETNVYIGAFDHVGISFLRLFVLLSTENYPDVMIPAFTSSRWNFLYFGLFVFVGVFFLTAIMLAIIVDSYWSFAKKHVKKERARERAELAKAWNLLDPLGNGSLPITDGRFLKLLKILKPHHTDEMNSQLIDYLDDNNDGQVDSLEWTIRLNEALSFEFEEDKFYDIDTGGSKFVFTMQSFCQKVIRSKAFSRIVLTLILLHCILFCLKWYGMSETAMLSIQILKTTIISAFLVEVVLRVLAEGRNLLQVIEMLDIALIFIAMVANIVYYVIPPAYYWICNIISGLAVLIRVCFNSDQTKKAVLVFSIKVFPVMFNLIIVVFIIISFFFSVLGWELFYDIPKDESYEAGVYEYNCGIGFDSFLCSWLMVFQIVTTSNWHEIMNAAMVATTDWVCIYFVGCFSTINLFVMNLFVAIVIEAYNKLGTERELEKAQNSDKKAQESEQEKSPRMSSSPRMRRPSRVPIIEEEEEEEPEEDLSGLSREERKKRQMKKKREKKKNKFKTMIVVITAFRATKDSELNLTVGEEIEVIGKQDEWWEGRKNDQQGWFPASHVREVKRSQVNAPVPLMQRPHMARKATEESLGWSDKDEAPMSPPGFTSRSSQDQLMSTTGSTSSMDTMTRRPKLKLKNTSGGNWRKDILGDITVINPQELKELNKILKAQHSMNASLGGTLRRQPTISESIAEESEPETKPEIKITPRNIPPPPVISVQQAPPMEQVIEEEEEEPEQDKDDSGNEGDAENTLTVEKPALPKELKKKKNKEQMKNGEMPSWASKFLQSNNIKASVDIKGSGDSKDHTAEDKV
ncbi:uncharacterized protein [Diadema antillarum]|uniref:uncharacterized protein n=1 Tax=Diadema antillarum TaxID=105358 RepID=UPI003A8B7C90